MKKKFRTIVVNNITYGWTINNDCDGDGGNMVTIWENKNPIKEILIYDGTVEITPSIVEKMIKDTIK
jgi:hypothetical protein